VGLAGGWPLDPCVRAPSLDGRAAPAARTLAIDAAAPASRAGPAPLTFAPSETPPANPQAVTSLETLARAAALRARGAALVLATGARLPVLAARLPFLPAADAYVAENGGRIFYPRAPPPTAGGGAAAAAAAAAPAAAAWPPSCSASRAGSLAAPGSSSGGGGGEASAQPLSLADLEEDTAWRTALVAAGPAADSALPPEARRGALWDAYRGLAAAGWAVDAEGYTANFRVRVRPPRTAGELLSALRALPPSLSFSFNMRAADVHPAAAGKAAAGEAVLARLGGAWAAALVLCDDDNDLELASRAARAFVPGLAAASGSLAAAAASAAPGRFWVAPRGGTLGAEDALAAAAAYVDELLARV
jgi:hypothetical protein